MVEKNDSSEEVESDIQSKFSNTPIPIVFQNCEGTQNSNLITLRNLISQITSPQTFLIQLILK